MGGAFLHDKAYSEKSVNMTATLSGYKNKAADLLIFKLSNLQLFSLHKKESGSFFSTETKNFFGQFLIIKNQFLSECIGAGILPPLSINASEPKG